MKMDKPVFAGLIPNVRFTTWDDYAIMSMAGCGLGISILFAKNAMSAF